MKKKIQEVEGHRIAKIYKNYRLRMFIKDRILKKREAIELALRMGNFTENLKLNRR